MCTIRTLVLAMLLGSAPALAQDIAGIEDCTKTTGLDRRTGCLQSNVNFLQRTMTRNALEAHRRLQAAESELAAQRVAITELRKQLDALAAARKADDKQKTDEKKSDGKAK